MRSPGRVSWPRYLFPLALLGFIGPAVLYANQIFTINVRWAIAAALAGLLLLNGKFGSLVRTDVGRTLLLSAVWALLTYFWSSVPRLSLMKAMALVLVSAVMFAAGHWWARRVAMVRVLDYLLPTVALAIVATLVGTAAPQGITKMGDLELYQGLTGNPNMLGTLLAMTVPVLLWRAYRARRQQVRWFWSSLVAVVVISQLLANSRAALLVTLITLMAFIFVLPLRRRVTLVLSGLILSLLAVSFTPGWLEKGQERYLYKGGAREAGVLATREDVWEKSYGLAVQGGWFGGGYGVTIGDESFDGGFTAVGYGREKGNSQLAIMEETGIVGLVLYLAFLAILFRRLYRAFRFTPGPAERVLLALATGSLAGWVTHGTFEAWWVAPGSPEAAYWWALVGVATGIAVSVEQRARLAKASAWGVQSRTESGGVAHPR